MSNAGDTIKTATSKSAMQRILDTVERVGNSVPHPVVIFLILIGIVLVLSHLLYMLGRPSRTRSSIRIRTRSRPRRPPPIAC